MWRIAEWKKLTICCSQKIELELAGDWNELCKWPKKRERIKDNGHY
jgi:hypothetical protein